MKRAILATIILGLAVIGIAHAESGSPETQYNRAMQRVREARQIDSSMKIFGYTGMQDGVVMLSHAGCMVKGSLANGWHLGVIDSGNGMVSTACWAKDFNQQIGADLVTFCEASRDDGGDWKLSSLSGCMIIGADRVREGDPRPRNAFDSPSATQPDTATPAQSAPKTVVDLGKFDVQANAIEWRNKVKSEFGLPAYIDHQGGKYLLRMGPFDSRDVALAAAAKLRAAGYGSSSGHLTRSESVAQAE
jgi:hypothetical protein